MMAPHLFTPPINLEGEAGTKIHWQCEVIDAPPELPLRRFSVTKGKLLKGLTLDRASGVISGTIEEDPAPGNYCMIEGEALSGLFAVARWKLAKDKFIQLGTEEAYDNMLSFVYQEVDGYDVYGDPTSKPPAKEEHPNRQVNVFVVLSLMVLTLIVLWKLGSI